MIVVNDAYLLAPWADILYFADWRWWRDFGHRKRAEFKAFQGQKCTIENSGAMVDDPEIFMLHNSGHEGLSEKPNCLHTGSNGGYQAVNIATLAGAKRVVLLGYDMRFHGKRSHFHAGQRDCVFSESRACERIP